MYGILCMYRIQLLKASIIVLVNFYVCIEYTLGVRRIRLSLGKLVFHYNNTKLGSMLRKNYASFSHQLCHFT